MQAISTYSPAPSSALPGYDRMDPPTRSRRGLLAGICLSLLFHVMLFLSAPKSNRSEGVINPKALGPLVVHLNRAQPREPTPEPTPPPARSLGPIPAPLTKLRAMPRRAPVIAVPKSIEELSVPIGQAPKTTPPPQPASPPAMDFLAVLNAKRQASEDAAAHANAEARAASRASTADEIATANINRNLQSLPPGRDGTNGVFQIISKGTRIATFSFRGWTTDPNNSWRQVIEVDAGVQGDVELAIVRRMIELVRTHYQGDFNWESHRLGRVVLLSARQEDNAALEAFLMREFFSGG